MSDNLTPPHAPDDRLAGAVEESLRFRFRAFCATVVALAVPVGIQIFTPESI